MPSPPGGSLDDPESVRAMRFKHSPECTGHCAARTPGSGARWGSAAELAPTTGWAHGPGACTRVFLGEELSTQLPDRIANITLYTCRREACDKRFVHRTQGQHDSRFGMERGMEAREMGPPLFWVPGSPQMPRSPACPRLHASLALKALSEIGLSILNPSFTQLAVPRQLFDRARVFDRSPSCSSYGQAAAGELGAASRNSHRPIAPCRRACRQTPPATRLLMSNPGVSALLYRMEPQITGCHGAPPSPCLGPTSPNPCGGGGAGGWGPELDHTRPCQFMWSRTWHQPYSRRHYLGIFVIRSGLMPPRLSRGFPGSNVIPARSPGPLRLPLEPVMACKWD